MSSNINTNIATGTINDNDKTIKWTNDHEKLLAKWADIANCYFWLHDNTYEFFKKRNMFFAIPIIILSTISGTANYGMDQIFRGIDYANLIIGTIGLCVAVISTISNFLRFAELSESHRVAAIQWGKFNRLITTELALQNSYRQSINDYMLICRSELDRLLEQSPNIPKQIQIQFKQKFNDVLNIELPVELDNIKPTYICKNDSNNYIINIPKYLYNKIDIKDHTNYYNIKDYLNNLNNNNLDLSSNIINNNNHDLSSNIINNNNNNNQDISSNIFVNNNNQDLSFNIINNNNNNNNQDISSNIFVNNNQDISSNIFINNNNQDISSNIFVNNNNQDISSNKVINNNEDISSNKVIINNEDILSNILINNEDISSNIFVNNEDLSSNKVINNKENNGEIKDEVKLLDLYNNINTSLITFNENNQQDKKMIIDYNKYNKIFDRPNIDNQMNVSKLIDNVKNIIGNNEDLCEIRKQNEEAINQIDRLEFKIIENQIFENKYLTIDKILKKANINKNIFSDKNPYIYSDRIADSMIKDN